MRRLERLHDACRSEAVSLFFLFFFMHHRERLHDACRSAAVSLYFYIFFYAPLRTSARRLEERSSHYTKVGGKQVKQVTLSHL
jgi:hypothetical protein